MYTGDIISKLNKHVMRFGNCDYYVKQHVEDAINTLGNECVRWSIEDFEQVAENKEGNDWEEWYDKNRFEEALHAMINKHDATLGINWETVDYYLEEYCRKKNPPIK